VTNDSIDFARQRICEMGRRLWTRGLCAGSDGNISIRLPDGGYLCTPSGQSKGFLAPESIVQLSSDRKPVGGGKPSSEIQMHLAIYEERPDVHAVIHSHPPTATGFALAHRLPATWVYAEADVLLHPISLVQYVTPGDHRLADAVRPAARGSDVLLLANHGAVCVDADLEQAYFKMEMLESFTQILLAADRAGGAKQFMTPDQGELAALRRKLRGDRFGPSSNRG
jgi:L-fuculose-phosphate aldolase